MKRVFIALLLLAQVTVAASSFGLRLDIVSPQSHDAGVGIDGFALIDINRNFYFYPNVGFWFSSDNHHDYYYENHHYYDSDFQIWTVAFNADFMGVLPTGRVKPYIGMGVAPILGYEHWHYNDYRYEDHHNDMEIGINVFGGLMFPIGRQSVLFELRGQVADYYSSVRMSFGLNFK